MLFAASDDSRRTTAFEHTGRVLVGARLVAPERRRCRRRRRSCRRTRSSRRCTSSLRDGGSARRPASRPCRYGETDSPYRAAASTASSGIRRGHLDRHPVDGVQPRRPPGRSRSAPFAADDAQHLEHAARFERADAAARVVRPEAVEARVRVAVLGQVHEPLRGIDGRGLVAHAAHVDDRPRARGTERRRGHLEDPAVRIASRAACRRR